MVDYSINLIFFPQQPTELVSKEREEKVKETQEDKFEGEAAKRETKEVQTVFMLQNKEYQVQIKVLFLKKIGF